jgi:hypothetical protein
MYMVGETASNILPITSGTYQTSFGGGTFDGFLHVLMYLRPQTKGKDKQKEV